MKRRHLLKLLRQIYFNVVGDCFSFDWEKHYPLLNRPQRRALKVLINKIYSDRVAQGINHESLDWFFGIENLDWHDVVHGELEGVGWHGFADYYDLSDEGKVVLDNARD